MMTFRRNDQLLQYEVLMDDVVAGRLGFYEHLGRLVLDVTRVDDGFAGQGLAGVVTKGALDDARERGVKVLPMCPYVTGWLAKHPEYEDLVDRELLREIEGGA